MRDNQPLFTAVSHSARQLYSLLRCIAFTRQAQVHLSEEGLRFSTAELSVMEVHAFLDKKLFSSFQYNAPDHDAEDGQSTVFEINLAALLETLQILGGIFSSDAQSASNSRFQPFNKPVSAFSAATLGLSSLCTITYPDSGEPLTIILSEANVETKCELTTYEPEQTEDIPFAPQKLAVKVIMRSEWLADAISELAATNPESMTIEAGPGMIGFKLSATGPLGSAEVEFDKAKANTANPPAPNHGHGVLETFLVQRRNANSYKFSMIRAATLAMKQAIKVSIRVDDQGVLSLQFMIEVESGSGGSNGEMSFVDFRFVPLLSDDEGAEEAEGDGGDASSTDDE